MDYSFFHRFVAAAFAISVRRSGVIALARAAPPLAPSAFAAGSLPSSIVSSSISPVAICMTRTALPMTSAGRFWPLGPVGMRFIRPFEQMSFLEAVERDIYKAILKEFELALC